MRGLLILCFLAVVTAAPQRFDNQKSGGQSSSGSNSNFKASLADFQSRVGSIAAAIASPNFQASLSRNFNSLSTPAPVGQSQNPEQTYHDASVHFGVGAVFSNAVISDLDDNSENPSKPGSGPGRDHQTTEAPAPGHPNHEPTPAPSHPSHPNHEPTPAYPGYQPNPGPAYLQNYQPAPAPDYQPAPAPGYQPASAPVQNYEPASAPSYQPASAPVQNYQPAPAPVRNYQPAPVPAQSYLPASPPEQGYPPATPPEQSYLPASPPGQSYQHTPAEHQNYQGQGNLFSQPGQQLPSEPASNFGAHPQYAQQQQSYSQISKHFYIHSAPEEPEDFEHDEKADDVPSRQHYKVLFIKNGGQSAKSAAKQLARAQNQEKTVVYVLNKQTDLAEIQANLQTVQQPTKPEVFFVKYKTPEEAAHAQQQIQAQYDALGGTSEVTDEGIAPSQSFVGILGNSGQSGNQGHFAAQQYAEGAADQYANQGQSFGPGSPAQLGSSPSGPAQFGAGPSGPAQVGAGPSGPAQFGAGPSGPAQFGAGPSGPAQFGAGPSGPAQFGAGPSGPAQFGAGPSGPAQFGAGPSGPAQFGAGPSGSAQSGPAQSGPVQVNLSQFAQAPVAAYLPSRY